MEGSAVICVRSAFSTYATQPKVKTARARRSAIECGVVSASRRPLRAGRRPALHELEEPRMRVREIMKRKVYTVAPSDSVTAVVNRFRTNRIHHLVVANGAKVVGLVSHHDIHRAAEDGADRTRVSDV